MSAQTGRLQRIWDFFFRPSEIQREIMAESWPFLVFLTVVLTGMSITMVFQHPQFDDPLRLGVFLALIAVHILAHWLSGWSSLDRRWSAAYIIFQGLLAAAIVFYTGLPEIAFGLFAALVGETIGIFGLSFFSASGALFFLTLQPVVFFLVGGTQLIRDFGPPALATSLLLIVMMVLIRRSLDAGDRAKDLLGELETTHKLLADYAAEVEALTLAAERQRMARDLHDTLAQGLAGLVMQLEAARHHLGAGSADRTDEILNQAMDRARSTLEGARRVIDDLHEPPEIGLAALVKQRAGRFQDATGIPCEVTLDLENDFAVRLDIRDHADRILGESLANIAVHAAASKVSVRVVDGGERFELEIIDDGKGFDPQSPTPSGHYGLIGLRERARLAGGSLHIDSKPGSGTRIAANLPARTG